MNKIKWIKTPHRGLRYYEHSERRHGKKKDRYYSIRLKVAGKDYSYGVGWVSDGIPEEIRNSFPEIGFEEYCLSLMREYKNNLKRGTGPVSPKERRKLAEEKKAEEAAEMQAEKERQEQEAISVSNFFNDIYEPWSKGNKAENTFRVEGLLFKNWIDPVMGEILLLKVAQTDIERVKKAMFDKGKSPKTVHLTLALIRQIFNYAKSKGVYKGDNPISKVKMPKVDNAKMRYLTPGEIDQLLNALKKKSQMVHDQALLSVSCGMRFSEVAGVRLEDVNFQTQTLAIRDGKTGSRTVFLSDAVSDMLKKRKGEQKQGLIFPGEDGARQERCSKTFQRVADELFNKDVNDRRLKVTFHTLRHTFGTHVYGESGDLYLTQKALGHKTMVMAARYAKMTEPRLREAFRKLSDTINNKDIGNVAKLEK